MRRSNIEVRDSVFDPDGSPGQDNVLYRNGDQRPLYRVFLYLDGKDLPYVDRVTYHLHETFPRPKRVVRRTPANPRCKLVLWTWGIFQVRAVIRDKEGQEHQVVHGLTYDQEFSRLPRERFVEDLPQSGSTPS